MRPIEIVGGGLAGLSLGMALRREGVPVTLREAGAYPRHRVCGEFITGLSAATIRRLQLSDALAGALHHESVTWYARAEPVRRQRLPSPALGLSRQALDARLAEAFVAAGGELRTHSRVARAVPAEGRVLCVGRHPARSAWIGLKVHARLAEPESGLEVHLGEEAYVGLSAVEQHRFNVCGFFRRRPLEAAGNGPALFLAYLRANGLEALAARVAGGIDPGSFCAVAGLQIDPRVRARHGVALGDACAMIPPFTGNGMAMAFQSAEIALPFLAAYARGETGWDAAERAIHGALRRRFALRLASASTLHPYLLRPRRQRWLAAAARARLLPLRPLYLLLH